MLRMKPAFLYQSEKSSGFSPVYALIPRTTLIRLLLVLLLVSVSILFSLPTMILVRCCSRSQQLQLTMAIDLGSSVERLSSQRIQQLGVLGAYSYSRRVS